VPDTPGMPVNRPLPPSFPHGIDQTGTKRPLLVDEDGRLQVAGGGGGGSGDGLTDAELRAAPVEVTVINGGIESVGNDGIANIGNADTPAAADSGLGNYGVVAALKRGLLNWFTLLSRIPSLSISGRVPTEDLGQAIVARQLVAGVASANTVLTSTCRRISIHARDAAVRYSVGNSAQTASATSHYLAQGERIDLLVPASANIAVIRADAASGVLELTELG
jgi:hypothetical protein